MSQEESATITETENITKTSPETENVPKETKNEQIEQTDQNKSEPQSENQTSTKNDVQENQQENQTEEQKKDVFEQTPLNSNFPGEPNFFPQMGEMFGEPGAIPEMQQQNIPNYAFAEGNENTSLFPGSFGQNFQGQIPQTDENFSYGVGSPQMGEAGANIDMMAAANPQMYQDMAQVIPRGEFSSVSQPDSKLCPARLSQEELQRELGARGLVYSEDDQVANIARLVNYLVDREYGESDLSSNEEPDFNAITTNTRRLYNFLEVILINCESQRKPLLDWLETWRSAYKDVNQVEIVELSENNLIKIRIYNKFSESSGVVDQLNSVKIKCARYYCYSRGDNWGGWEYYEDGVMQKKENYDSERAPPLFWKRLCWFENAGVDGDKFRNDQLTPEQVCAILGTDEEMICVDCGNSEKRCRAVHGSFNGHFKSKDLYSRYSTLVSPDQ